MKKTTFRFAEEKTGVTTITVSLRYSQSTSWKWEISNHKDVELVEDTERALDGVPQRNDEADGGVGALAAAERPDVGAGGAARPLLRRALAAGLGPARWCNQQRQRLAVRIEPQFPLKQKQFC